MTQQNKNINSQPTTIGERIKKLRLDHKWSQNYAASVFNSNKSSWSRIEKGEYDPDLDLVRRICDEWKVTPNYLLLGMEDTEEKIDISMLPPFQQHIIKETVESFKHDSRYRNRYKSK